MRKTIILLICTSTIIVASCKESATANGDDRPQSSTKDSAFVVLLDSLRSAANVPALACAIISDTGLIHAQAVGSRRYGGPENVTSADQFHLGSNTKAMTAALIGMLVDDSLLTWDSTLPSIFPEYAATMRAEYSSVTVRDILSHSAGLAANTSQTFTTTTIRDQRTELLAWALVQPPVNAKGIYNYSNVGYIIAAAIAEKLTNRSYEDLLFERLIQPLGITTAGFGPMGTAGLDDQPLQHTPQYQPLEPTALADNPPVYNSAGRLHMSIGDWGRYIQWVLACEAGHGTLLRSETARTLTTGAVSMPGEGSYAFGWAVVNRPWANGRTLTHSGSNTLNYSVAWLAPNRRFAVIAATNICATSTPVAMDGIAGRLIAYYLNGR